MKEEVVKFLANQPKNDSEKFNKAVGLYRQSKGNDPSIVRFMNSMGFSKDRLENVLYELKKLHSITDLEIAKAKPGKKLKKVSYEPEFIEVGGLVVNAVDFSEEEKIKVKTVLESFAALGEGVILDKEKEEAEQLANLSDFASAITEYSGNAPEGEDRESLVNFILDEIVKAALHEPTEEELQSRKEAFGRFQSNPLGVKNLEVKDAEFIAVNANGGSANDFVDDHNPKTSQATSDTPEATDDNTPAPIEKTDDSKDESTSEDAQATQDGPSEEFKKKLAGFDVEAEKYNSVKSFAADVSDVIKEDPKDQKGATLKAFILDAKKKFAEI